MTLSLNRRTLSPLHCASADATRYSINSLHIEADGTTIATDGHLMAVVTPASPLEGSSQLEPFTLEADHLKALNKEQRKKNAPDATIDLEATNANGHCRIEIPGAGAVEIPKLAFDYPDWRQVQTSEPPEFSVCISLIVLEQMIATARQFTDTTKGKTAVMRFDFPKESELKPFTATHEHPDGDTLKVTMMPCRK